MYEVFNNFDSNKNLVDALKVLVFFRNIEIMMVTFEG